MEDIRIGGSSVERPCPNDGSNCRQPEHVRRLFLGHCSKAGPQVVFERPSDDLATECIEHNRQIGELLGKVQIRDVGDPD